MSLVDYREEVLASVAGSTAAIDFPDILPFLQRHLDAAAGRGEAAGLRARERSAKLRGAIRKAASALPRGYPETALVSVVRRRLQRNLEAYGLEREPCLNTIRSEIRSMQNDVISVVR